ncbi:MAG: RNA recognition motif domain-containing protein [Candidatus Latescibacterota bacterium]
MRIYVGNLSFNVVEEDLRELFQEFGQVESVNIITDNYTGQSKGFGFVEIPNRDEALKAIEGLNGKEVKGRALTVNEARPKPEGGRGGGGRPGGGSRSGGGGGGGNRGGGGGGGRGRY